MIARDPPQALFLAHDPTLEDVHVADELGDEPGFRLLVDLRGSRDLRDPAALHKHVTVLGSRA